MQQLLQLLVKHLKIHSHLWGCILDCVILSRGLLKGVADGTATLMASLMPSSIAAYNFENRLYIEKHFLHIFPVAEGSPLQWIKAADSFWLSQTWLTKAVQVDFFCIIKVLVSDDAVLRPHPKQKFCCLLVPIAIPSPSSTWCLCFAPQCATD